MVKQLFLVLHFLLLLFLLLLLLLFFFLATEIENGGDQLYFIALQISRTAPFLLHLDFISVQSSSRVLYNAAKFRSWEHLGRQLRFYDLKILGHVNEVIPYRLVEVFFN